MTLIPTKKQIENCIRIGWAYEGLGLFSKDDLLGHFTFNGWEYL